MKPFYKAWQVFEIEDPADWLAKRNMIREHHGLCYVDGLDAKVVTVFSKNESDFSSSKAEEVLWDIFGEPCLYLSNSDFQDFIDVWEKFLALQQGFWEALNKGNKNKINISLIQKSLITIGSYKLLQNTKLEQKSEWDEKKMDVLLQLLREIYTELQGVEIAVWGKDDFVVAKLQAEGIIVRPVIADGQQSASQALISSANQADGLVILSDCQQIREIPLSPVLENMKQKYIFDTCYIFEISEIEKLGARLLYC